MPQLSPRFLLRRRDDKFPVSAEIGRLLGADEGSVHLGIRLCDGPGDQAPKVHAFDKAIYVLSGQVALRREGQRIRLHQGAYVLIRAGRRHQLDGSEGAAQWMEICAPQPREAGRGEPDTVEVPGWPLASCEELALGDPRTEGCGSFDARMPVPFELLPGLSGVSVRMLLDVAQGAVHFNLFVVDIQQGGWCDHHDHPFEEAYFLLSGEVELTVDGRRHTLRAGDFAWTGVGAAHAFHAKGPARWLEVQSPLPPSRDGMRWHAPWRQLFSSLLASRANNLSRISLDAASVPSPPGGRTRGPNRTDRGKRF